MKDLRMVGREGADGASRRAVALLAERAGREGLLDVAFVSVPSPFGDLVVATTPRGLVRLAYPDEDRDRVLQELATRVSPRMMEAPGRLDAVRRQLEEYFAGTRQRFDVPVDYELTRGFTRKVLRATSLIPFGSLSTYMEVAGRAGNPRAYRAAGNALGSNPIPIVVPCHRVVHADGGLGGYTGGLDRKRFLLSLEGAL
jgi:methylated-DNA-[protein]-cysteine S-methyltransferase